MSGGQKGSIITLATMQIYILLYRMVSMHLWSVHSLYKGCKQMVIKELHTGIGR